jgi:hypothetical protein
MAEAASQQVGAARAGPRPLVVWRPPSLGLELKLKTHELNE